jgi:23S rRNA-/tRNA-specific pseudouridylate synthase
LKNATKAGNVLTKRKHKATKRKGWPAKVKRRYCHIVMGSLKREKRAIRAPITPEKNQSKKKIILPH